MKKPAMGILVLITCIFTAFAVGLFAGRQINRTPVRIWQVSAAVTEAETEQDTTTVIININTASSEQLRMLPGIGPVLAERIIAWRDENGPFRAPEELMKVSGIGAAKLEEIWDLITTGGYE